MPARPIIFIDVDGVLTPLGVRDDEVPGFERITLPNQEADGTQCFVHFAKVDGAMQYDVWAAPYEDGRGALQLGKAWKEPGLQVRGLRPNQKFYLFVTYTDAEGKVSKPSPAYQIELEDFFGMK